MRTEIKHWCRTCFRPISHRGHRLTQCKLCKKHKRTSPPPVCCNCHKMFWTRAHDGATFGLVGPICGKCHNDPSRISMPLRLKMSARARLKADVEKINRVLKPLRDSTPPSIETSVPVAKPSAEKQPLNDDRAKTMALRSSDALNPKRSANQNAKASRLARRAWRKRTDRGIPISELERLMS